MNQLRKLLTCAALVSALLIQPALSAKTEEWKDTQGKKFKGEPTEIYGPFAFFRTSKYTGRRVLLQFLPPAECVRLEAIVKNRAPLASDWSQSHSLVARELTGCVEKLEGEKVVPTTLAGRPEPQFLVVVFCNHGDGTSWATLDEAEKIYPQIQTRHPGKVEFLYFGGKHSSKDHKNMALAKRVPWLLATFDRQSSMEMIGRMVPGENGYGILLLSSDGIPLLQEYPENAEAAAKTCSSLVAFLDLGLPENPLAWKDRAYYLRATLPASHATDACPPTLVGNPLSPEALKKAGVKTLRANLSIAASGAIEGVMLNSDSLQAELRGPITAALKQCVFVPAIDKGQFVAGSYVLEMHMN